MLNTTAFSAAAPAVSASANSSNTTEHFVTITDNGDFAVGCEVFYPFGWNQ